ncbi:hypothetical protein ONZ45_g12130 [Pleurotus djamor]|nr:hypothetical protein ONZ45_g12130 [Pleurotus djamor]
MVTLDEMTQVKSPWIEWLPAPLIPYAQLARLHYFDGPNMFFWSIVPGIALAAGETNLPGPLFVKHLAVQFFASVVLHGFGSAWDDICDRHIDAQVERTKGRPLVIGTATLPWAFALVIFQASILVELLRRSNQITALIGSIGLFVFVPTYPFMKRITYWPQAWLGVTLAIYTLCAYTSITGNFTPQSAITLICFGIVCWCIHYDTVYGVMDLEDDIRIGVKSTAVLFGDHIRPILACFALAVVGSFLAAGIAIGAPISYYAFSVVGTAMHLAWQLYRVDFKSNASCAALFQSNSAQLGWIVAIGFLSVYVLSQ